MPTISIAIQKGGSGKTTTTVNLAAALQRSGSKVLLIDSDPQCNLSQSLGVEEEQAVNLYSEFRKEITGRSSDLASAVIMTRSGLRLIPGSIDLALAEIELVGKFNREQTLRNKMLRPIVGDYDYIFIDCPPSFGLLTVNALVASDYVIIPLQAEYLPFNGVRSFYELMDMMKDIPNMDLTVAGFVLTKFSAQRRLNREIRTRLEEEFDARVFGTIIRTDIRLACAQRKGVDIFSYSPASNGAKDYAALAEEFVARLEAAPIQKPMTELV